MRVLVSLALIASGVVAVLADAQRWSPACAGGFDELDCLLLQDHMYDFALPAEPWVPIGTSAHLMALNYALLAVAMLGFARVLVRAWWAWFLGAPFALSFVVLAVTTYRSAIAGRVVEPDGFGYDVALYTYILPWPAALLLGSAVGGLPLRSSVVRGARAVAARCCSRSRRRSRSTSSRASRSSTPRTTPRRGTSRSGACSPLSPVSRCSPRDGTSPSPSGHGRAVRAPR